jgi:hypothetical protein
MDHLLDQDHDTRLIAALRRLDAARDAVSSLDVREAVKVVSGASELLERAVWGGEGRAA